MKVRQPNHSNFHRLNSAGYFNGNLSPWLNWLLVFKLHSEINDYRGEAEKVSEFLNNK